MTCRVYVDNYYSGVKNTLDMVSIQVSLEKYLNEHFQDRWRFGIVESYPTIRRCIYFNHDEDASVFLLKTSIPCHVVYER